MDSRSPASAGVGNDIVMTDDLVLVGRFGRAQGLKGEIRLTSFTGEPAAIAGYGPLISDDGRSFALESVVARGDVLVARVAGVADRTAAEALTNLDLYVPRARLSAPAAADEFLQADLLGCLVETADGARIGRVVDLPNYGAGDILEIARTGGGHVLLPFRKEFVPMVDVAMRRIVVNLPDGLDEG